VFLTEIRRRRDQPGTARHQQQASPSPPAVVVGGRASAVGGSGDWTGIAEGDSECCFWTSGFIQWSRAWVSAEFGGW
jgi:hypothetical protein